MAGVERGEWLEVRPIDHTPPVNRAHPDVLVDMRGTIEMAVPAPNASERWERPACDFRQRERLFLSGSGGFRNKFGVLP